MPTKMTPKDFFLYLGATIALYVSAVALINLSFSSVNYAFPDALAGYFSADSIVWPISMLIILVPTLYILEWLVRKDLLRDPEKKNIWIRRWRIYLTLFITGATILGDLVALINTYLNGEISTRFIYKILVVLIVAGVVFTFYIFEITNNENNRRNIQRIFAWLGIIIVLASIIGGFVIVGSPAKQRDLRLDRQRINDLSSIQWQIVSYWQKKAGLPGSIDTLNDPISGFTIPTDPVTHESYEYVIPKGDNRFLLCAVFARSSQDDKNRGDVYTGYSNVRDTAMPYVMLKDNDVWTHEAGRACFDRTIDPYKYPLMKN